MITTQRKIVLPTPKPPAPVRGTGIVKGNPKRCIICQKEIQDGDHWLKYTSPSDPVLPSYSLVTHKKCEPKKP